jgi:hypothetical protein
VPDPVGGANSPHTSGDHEFKTAHLATLELGDLFKFKNRPIDWHKHLLLLSKLAADLNRIQTFEARTLAGDHEIGLFDPLFQRLDPGGANRVVELPPENDTVNVPGHAEAQAFLITNTGTEQLQVVYNDCSPLANTIVHTLAGGESAWFYTDGSTWEFVEVAASSGGGSAGSEKCEVDLVGAKNASNLVFTTPDDFIQQASGTRIKVYMNGQRLNEGAGCDFVASESGGVGTGYDTITLHSDLAPESFDILFADYVPSA